MKLIDLLNKIANGEEVPKKVKYKGYIYQYQYNDNREANIINYYYSEENHYHLIDGGCHEIRLNDEVEILEEKKIPEKIDLYEDEEGHYFIDKHCKKIYITCDEINFMVEEFNQLIDYLKSKGDE